MNAPSRISRPMRGIAAVAVLAAGLVCSAFTASMIGLYLGENESGLDRLAQGYTLWALLLSVLMGTAGIAGFRVLLRRRAASRWLLTALVVPMACAVVLAFGPTTPYPSSSPNIDRLLGDRPARQPLGAAWASPEQGSLAWGRPVRTPW
jgi:membrane protease YdiL (CAAX protease family)